MKIEIFQFKDKTAQATFKNLTTETTEFTKCFENDLNFEEQAANWKKVLNDYFHKAFKKVRIKHNYKTKKTKIKELMEKRNILRKKTSSVSDDAIEEIEDEIATIVQEENKRKVMENFSDIDGSDEFLSQHGLWKVKRKTFPKFKPSLPVGKKTSTILEQELRGCSC